MDALNMICVRPGIYVSSFAVYTTPSAWNFTSQGMLLAALPCRGILGPSSRKFRARCRCGSPWHSRSVASAPFEPLTE
uniref:Pco089553b n=1 Tax=Arundo donax TaxID=35708 RepID=A0A0A9DB90_ARUDO